MCKSPMLCTSLPVPLLKEVFYFRPLYPHFPTNNPAGLKGPILNTHASRQSERSLLPYAHLVHHALCFIYLTFFFFFETGSLYVALAILELDM